MRKIPIVPCAHCRALIKWYPTNWGTRYPVNAYIRDFHYCIEYLDALRAENTTRKMPRSWAYIPADVAEQRLELHYKPGYRRP